MPPISRAKCGLVLVSLLSAFHIDSRSQGFCWCKESQVKNKGVKLNKFQLLYIKPWCRGY